MSDLRDFTGKNRKFTGTIGERISTGTTAERDTNFGQGTLRFNTTTTLLEYYDGTQWKPIDAPPTISGVSPATFASDGSTIHTITVTGTNFGVGLTAKFIGQDGTNYTPGTVTRVSASSLTITTLTSMTVANEPYDIQVTNVSGLSSTLENALDAGSSPAFTATAGSLGTLTNANRVATALATQTFGPATDADGQQINYSITSGSISPGLRLGTPNDGNNGKIVGTASAVGSNTTSTFTIQASDGVNTSSRQYSITVNAPVRQSFTAAGSFTFTVPTGLTSINVLVVAGGGGGGSANDIVGSDGGGGAGAGGLVYVPAYSVTPGQSISGNVGSGGPTSPGYGGAPGFGVTGQDSTFGNLTAKGGGFGVPPANTAGQGGSGGGGGYAGATQGSGIQPNQPGQSGTYGFGNPGGGPTPSPAPYTGSGGGGAGAAGQNRSGGVAGAGGIGKAYTIADGSTPVYYAGGGGGGGAGPSATNGATGGQGGGGPGGNANAPAGSARDGTQGTLNTGGGGGGGAGAPGDSTQAGKGGAGGRGIVIIEEVV